MKAAPDIDIEFGPRPPGRGGGIVLLVLGVAALVAAAQWYADIGDDLSAFNAGMARMDRQARAGAQPEPRGDSSAQKQEIHAANAVVARLTVPWDALFRELESSAGKDVALLSVQPDPQSRQVRITGEARNLDAVLGYVRRLSDSDELDEVYLQEHSIRTSDPQHPVAFSITAGWVEP
jgi:hypothetical protein